MFQFEALVAEILNVVNVLKEALNVLLEEEKVCVLLFLFQLEVFLNVEVPVV